MAVEMSDSLAAMDVDAPAAVPWHRALVIDGLFRLLQLGSLLVLGCFWVAMGFLSPPFFTTVNFSNMLQAAAIPGILALGQLFVIVSGSVDLSAGAILILVSVSGVKFAHEVSGDAAVVVLLMLGVGAAVGLVNGVLIEYLRIGSAFVVTLGTLSIATGAVYIVSRGITLTGAPHFITSLGGYWGQLPIAIVVLGGAALIAAVASSRIKWGRWLYAIGSNREAAMRVGIPVAAVSASTFVLSGVAAALAGVVTVGLTDAGTPAVSLNSELDAITAVVIGGAALTGGRGTVWGTVVGLLIIETIHNSLNLLNIDNNWEPVVLGAVLIGAVGLERGRSYLETQVRLAEARMTGDL